jgi:hypothetical protein
MIPSGAPLGPQPIVHSGRAGFPLRVAREPESVGGALVSDELRKLATVKLALEMTGPLSVCLVPPRIAMGLMPEPGCVPPNWNDNNLYMEKTPQRCLQGQGIWAQIDKAMRQGGEEE